MMHYGANNYGKQLCALAGAAVVFALLGGCAEDASSGRSTTTTTSRAASGPSDAAVASAAEKMLRDDAELKGVACQGDGTTWLPVGWDHRGALLRMLVGVVWVKLAGSGALPVGRAFDDEGVGGGGESVDR